MPTGYLVPASLPVEINGRQYQIDYEGVRRHVLPRDRPAVNSTALGGASSLNPEAGALRVQTDWSLGSAQEMFDDSESDPRRYYRGRNLQAVRRGRIQLSNKLVQVSSARGFGQIIVPWSERTNVQTGNSLFWIEFASPNYTLFRQSITGGPYGGVISPATSLGASATSMLCLATDGSATTWMSRGGSGVSRATTETGGWTAAWSAVPTNLLVYANGHLLGIAGAAVWEFDNAGAKLGGVDIFTHPNPSWIWQGGVAGTGLIYLWGNSGTDAAVYVVSDILQGGTLAPPKIALPLPPGEIVLHMEPIGGYFLARTNIGVRVLTPNGDVLESGPLITQRDLATDPPNLPSCVSATSDGVMVAWRAISTQPDFISRLDLARFTSDDAPAHHHLEYVPVEVVAANNAIGAMRVVHRTDTQFAGNDLWVFGGTTNAVTRRVWAATLNQAPNTLATPREKAPTGDLYTGWISYETSDFKVPVELLILCDTIPTGATIDVSFVDDGGTETLITTMPAGIAGTAADLSATGFKPRRFQLKFTLNRGTDVAATPTIESWQVRCRLIPQRQEEIFLPIQLTSVVTGENDQEIGQSPYDEFVALKAIVTAGVPVVLKEGSLSQRVFVDDIQLADGSSAMSMLANAFYEGTYTVRCVGAY